MQNLFNYISEKIPLDSKAKNFSLIAYGVIRPNKNEDTPKRLNYLYQEINKILTKFSDCLTDNFFEIIFFAKSIALSRPTKIFAWPCDNFSSIISSIISWGNVKSLKQLEMCALLLPINLATLS